MNKDLDVLQGTLHHHHRVNLNTSSYLITHALYYIYIYDYFSSKGRKIILVAIIIIMGDVLECARHLGVY